MLKKFFIAMLGSMAGFWLSLFFLIVLGIASVGVLIGKSMGSSETTEKNILHLQLSGDVTERGKELQFTDLLDLNNLSGETLANITQAIREASKDKNIHGIFIDCKGAQMGSATASEIIDAIKKFKETGKWVYAYADNYSQADYYVASAADKVYLNPQGMIDVHGLGAVVPFFKNLLDKVGVEMQVVKVGTYKSAVEPFIRTDMSQPSREQTSVYLDQIWDSIKDEIAKGRDVTAANVDTWADSISMTWAPAKYVESSLVNELIYRPEFEDMLREKEDVKKGKKLPLVTPSEYLLSKNLSKLGNEGKDHIAVYYAVGDIVDEGTDGIVGPKVVSDIEKLANDDNVKALVLRVNSGGGSAFASEQIWHSLERFKDTGKPFYVSMGDYAASGGYYISCGADSIFADPATLTGSIGIFGMIPNAQKLITDKIGVNIDVVETNKGAIIPTLYAGMTPRQYDAMQSYVNRGYETFTGRVAQGRNLPIDSVKSIAEGRVWDGISALNIGLVDKLGSLEKAVTAISEAVNLDKNDYVCYPALDNEWIDALLNSGLIEPLSESSTMNVYKQVTTCNKYTDYVRSMFENSPLQARMHPVIVK